MEDYLHIYNIPRSQVQQDEESRDSRTESFLDNRKSRHDYEPVVFNHGESNSHQQPQVDDPNIQQTRNRENQSSKRQNRRFFCIYSITMVVALAALMVAVAVSLTVVTLRSNALGDQVADLQQQVDELKTVRNKANR